MNLNIKTTKDNKEVVDFVSSSINRELEKGKKVLWFVSGGSSIPVEVLIAKNINENFSKSLVVILADERYGNVDHEESNWFKLKKADFVIKNAQFIPILTGKKTKETIEDIRIILKHELEESDYKIGFFGVGIDGHTAGILPHTPSVHSDELICSYETDLYNRITITPKTILKLDEAILYAMGENKWEAIKKLEENLLIENEPVQILKKVPLLTIFTDYTKHELGNL